MRVYRGLLRKLRRRQRRQWDALYVSQRPWPGLTFENVAYGSAETCCSVTVSNCDGIMTVYWSCVSLGFELRLFGWPTVISEIALVSGPPEHEATMRVCDCLCACMRVYECERSCVMRFVDYVGFTA